MPRSNSLRDSCYGPEKKILHGRTKGFGLHELFENKISIIRKGYPKVCGDILPNRGNLLYRVSIISNW
jgi:hypothetical protein